MFILFWLKLITFSEVGPYIYYFLKISVTENLDLKDGNDF